MQREPSTCRVVGTGEEKDSVYSSAKKNGTTSAFDPVNWTTEFFLHLPVTVIV